MKKILACVMMLALLVNLCGCCLNIPKAAQKPSGSTQKPSGSTQKPSVSPQKPVDTEPEETEPVEAPATMEVSQDVLDALNGLMVGFVSQDGDVSRWSDADVCHFISAKLQWDKIGSTKSYMGQMGLNSSVGQDGLDHYDLEKVEKLTQDTLGRSIPKNKVDNGAYVANDEFLIMPAAGAASFHRIQHYKVRGDEIVAVGTTMFCGGYEAITGYFEAVVKENPSSVYGYTLVSVREISGNQTFKGLTAKGSSVLEDSKSYAAANAIDGNKKTAWVEGAYGDGVGQWLQISTADGSQMEISALELNLGYHKSDSLLTQNGRPVAIMLQFEDGTQQKAQYLSENTAILLDKPVKTSWVKITILEVIPGTVYPDTCISEVIFYGLSSK